MKTLLRGQQHTDFKATNQQSIKNFLVTFKSHTLNVMTNDINRCKEYFDRVPKSITETEIKKADLELFFV